MSNPAHHGHDFVHYVCRHCHKTARDYLIECVSNGPMCPGPVAPDAIINNMGAPLPTPEEAHQVEAEISKICEKLGVPLRVL